MWIRSHSTLTHAASAEQMFQLFAQVSRWPEWDEGLESTSLQGDFVAGNHFHLRPKGGPKVRIDLLEVESPHRFLDCTRFTLARMYDEHSFENTPQGLCVRHRIWMRGPLSWLWIRLVAGELARNMAQDMEKQIQAASKL